jgi:hypothetical protein
VNSYILYCFEKTQLEEKLMPHIGYQRALCESLVGEVHNTRKRSH